jgi:hypothetical protein
VDFKKATKAQLLNIILHEPCEQSVKLMAASEYKRRDRVGFNRLAKQVRMKRHRD